MKKLIVALSLSVWFAPVSEAQPPPFPPDFYNDFDRDGYALYENPNPGWVVNTSGQLQTDVQYVTEGALPRTYIRKEAEMSFVLSKVDTSISTLDTLRRLDMKLVGQYAQYPDAVALEQKDHHLNFYLPHCGPNGVTNVHGYSRIVYENIYPNIDLWVYSGQRGQKMMFVIHPQGDPAHIQMQFTGQTSLDVDVNGWLKLQMEEKWIVLPEAVAYQVDQNQEIVPVNWAPEYDPNSGNGIVEFTFDQYDRYKDLVLLIGPPPAFGGGPPYTAGICWSTYFGGEDWDKVSAIAIDDQGFQYVTGSTRSSFDNFPHTLGTVYWLSDETMFLSKFGFNNALNWTDFFGGTTSSQTSRSVAIRNGPVTEVFIGGVTEALDILLESSGSSYYDGTPELGKNGFLARFDPNGFMTWSTYFGNGDFTVEDITIDASGRLLAVGSTTGDLPVPDLTPPNGSEAWNYGGGPTDGWIARFNPDEMLHWISFVGGASRDVGTSVSSKAGKIIMTGVTESTAINNAYPGGNAYFQPANGGGLDIFIKEFDLYGAQQWGTFLGGSGTDQSTSACLDIDATSGDVFVVGTTSSTNIDTEAGDGWSDEVYGGGSSDGLIAQFDGADRSPEWISYLGEEQEDALGMVAISPTHKIYLGGVSQSDPLLYQPISGLYSEDQLLGEQDGVIFLFSAGHELLWGTYLGGNNDQNGLESISQIALYNDADLYTIGHTNAVYDPDNDLFFPLTNPQTGAWFDDVFDVFNDGFIVRFCVEALPVSTPAIEPLGEVDVTVLDGLILRVDGLRQGLHALEIFDDLGRLILSQHFPVASGPSTIALPRIATGHYVVCLDGSVSKAVIIIRP